MNNAIPCIIMLEKQQGNETHLSKLGTVSFPIRPMIHDCFYWNIDGTSHILEITSVFLNVDYINNQHQCSNTVVVRVRIKNTVIRSTT